MFFTPWYAPGGKKRSFFGKFGVLCILVTSVLRFALLSYYRRYRVWNSIFYLRKQRKQKTQLSYIYSSRSKVLFEVPEIFIVKPLLFNIFWCNLFLSISDSNIASYADNNTTYYTGQNIKKVSNDLLKGLWNGLKITT